MEEKALISNETPVNDRNFKKMMLYNKFHQDIRLTIIKMAICTFIIITSIILDMHRVDKVFCIFMGIVGIIDTLKIKDNKIKDVSVLKYDFFEDYFLANNQKVILEIPYTEIETIIDMEDFYYVTIKKATLFISKNGFTKGTAEELVKLVKTKNTNIKV